MYFKLKNGKEVRLYSRGSYNDNVTQYNGGGKPHWNFDIQSGTPRGEYLVSYKEVIGHASPYFKQLDFSIVGHEGKKDEYRIIWRKLGD